MVARDRQKHTGWALLSALLCTAGLTLSGPVLAQSAAPAASVPAQGNSTVVSLIQQLVQEGVLTQERASALIRQAQDEAAIATRSAQAAVPALASAPGAAPVAAPSVRVPYVPQIVRNEIRDEVKQEVLREAREQNWAAPNAVPAWTKRFHLSGDFRARYEWDLFDSRNSNAFPNFAALNAGAPFDLNNAAGTPPPILNTTQNRERMRIRARLGLNIDVADGLLAGVRLASGNTTTPTTTNQTLGTTLNKVNFLLDRAFLNYRPVDWFELWVGRFANPWLSTELVWDEDINFDGVAARLRGEVLPGLSLFATGGAFPIENTAFNFPDNTVAKGRSRDKWLYAGQLGMDWQTSRNLNFKLAAAYYHFTNMEGVLSSACVANVSADPCDSDNSRPGFMQQGNTLFAIRNLVSNLTNPPLFQYYGLASQFHDLDLNARMDAVFGSIHVIVDGDVVKNLAFSNRRILASNPINNIGPNIGSTPGVFDGGGLGYQARLTVGYPEIRERWQWNASFLYRHLDSDAVPDAFSESDFHLGGTNAKGYVIGGSLGLARNVDLTARWFSTSEVTSLPYSVDVVQVDLNARF
ncbi:MAG TPA: putative porin [Rhizomicrobium sp.]|nr:putative porin [Rhizomicrobium sp.]